MVNSCHIKKRVWRWDNNSSFSQQNTQLPNSGCPHHSLHCYCCCVLWCISIKVRGCPTDVMFIRTTHCAVFQYGDPRKLCLTSVLCVCVCVRECLWRCVLACFWNWSEKLLYLERPKDFSAWRCGVYLFNCNLLRVYRSAFPCLNQTPV